MDILYNIIVFGLIILAAYVLIKLVSAPIKWIFKLLLNAVMGLVILFLLNIVGSLFGFSIEINLISALVAGIFGFPGVVALVILQMLF